ncbi:MAG: TonB family protein [Bacteroidota bacterium]
MKEEKRDIIYTAEDIKRYITGGMSPLEMHAIEMAALDDPLLAEAMEGYELMEQKDWNKELAALKEEFNKDKKDETPVVVIAKTAAMKWWRAAAAVLVIGVAATTAYLFSNKNTDESTPQIATLKPVVTDSISVAKIDSAAPNFINVTTDSTTPLIAKADNLNTKGSVHYYSLTTDASGIASVTTQATALATDSSSFIYKPSAGPGYLAMKDDKAGEVSSREKEAVADMAVVTPSANNNAAGNSNNGAYYNEAEFKNKAEESITAATVNNAVDKYRANNFNGSIVSPDNKPVGFANINIPKVKKSIRTDANGKFYFTAPDTSVKVTVTSAGYSSQKITLQNSTASNTIVMQPMDVTVSALGKKRTDKAKAPVKWQQTYEDTTDLDDGYVIPVGGWDEYNKYLSSKLQYPDGAKQKNVHGEVEVTVKLNNIGEISQAKVTKPLSPECDAEAIRLVKEGPKWDMKNNSKKTIKVTVKF